MEKDQPIVPETLATIADLTRSVNRLVAIDGRFGPVVDAVGQLRLRRSGQGFAALAELIISQQLSVAASDTIIQRLKDAELFSRRAIDRASPEQLRACGVSPQKAGYLKTLAASQTDTAALAVAPDDVVIATLTRLRGIGTWTAEIYLMFALGRADVFPAGDLALQVAAASLLDLPERPSERTLREIAAGWAPCRAVAAQLLWSHYRHLKGREAVRG